MIVQGDAYGLPFIIKAGNTEITPSLVYDVTVQFGTLTKSYRNGEITYVNGKWRFPLSHQETLDMGGMTGFQVDVIFSGQTVRKRSKIEFEVVEPTIIEEVYNNA